MHGTTSAASTRPQGPACDSGAYELDTAPTVTITEGPTGTITINDVEFRFQACEPGPTVQCQLTGPGQTAGFVECYKSNAQPYDDLADGPYTFSVRAADAAFPNPPVTTRTFVVNTAPPNTTITGGPTGLSYDSTPTFTFTLDRAGSTFQCRSTARAFGACPSPHTRGALRGSHTFRVRAIDAAGTVDPTPAPPTWTVDTVAPNTTIPGGPTGTASSTSRDVHVHLDRAARDVPVLARRRRVRRLPGQLHRAGAGRRTPSRSAPSTRPATSTHARVRDWTVDTVAPDTYDHRPGPHGDEPQRATFTFTSRTSRRRSNARSTAPRSAPAPPATPASPQGVAHVPGPRHRRRPQPGPARRPSRPSTDLHGP